MMHMNTPLPSQEKLFPEQKPIRVTVPVTPEVQAAFQRLAAASGMSTGKAMGDWLADTLDAVLAMAEVMEKARSAPKQAVRELHAYAMGLTDMTSELMSMLRNPKTAAKAGAVEAPGGAPLRGVRSGAEAAPAPLPPRTVIRGGKSLRTPKKPGDH